MFTLQPEISRLRVDPLRTVLVLIQVTITREEHLNLICLEWPQQQKLSSSQTFSCRRLAEWKRDESFGPIFSLVDGPLYPLIRRRAQYTFNKANKGRVSAFPEKYTGRVPVCLDIAIKLPFFSRPSGVFLIEPYSKGDDGRLSSISSYAVTVPLGSFKVVWSFGN